MREIRPIVEEEAHPFLRLLCDVFGLDYARASSVFFSEPLYDLRRKWALFEQGTMASILTTTPLTFGWGRAIGIAGVGTRKGYERQGLGQALVEAVLDQAQRDGEGPAILFAHDVRLYERCGFRLIDRVIRGQLVVDASVDHPDELPCEEVRPIYDAWSEQHPSRLRRDESRWRFWNWGLRCCEPVRGGYLCVEPSLVREAVIEPGLPAWPVVPGTEWVGLQSLATDLGVPLASSTEHLLLMGRGFPEPPLMFMTDQF